ncbi:MAG: HlyD family efflux transporter periplasmic adaptor subunit [Tepidisphaera sp.]|nr:HlyD family efflux transporter periplasmic adaptor subunit [Tepidisphaera sp.]
MSERSTFSPFWHRVRVMKPRLRPHVQITRQHYRGRRWHVVHDPSSNQFYRINPVAHEFLGMLDGRRTVEEVWQYAITRHADEAMTQNEVIQLLSQLFGSNLLTADVPPETEQMLRRGRDRLGKRFQQQAIGLMYFRVRLFNPDRLLTWLLPVFRPLLSVPGLVLWAIWVLAGIITISGHLEDFLSRVGNALAPSNWLLMGVAFVAIKLWHELGHGLICKRFGGQVPELGAMMLVLIPAPYVDASSAWTFKSRWQRMLVGAGGMIFELTVASAAAFVWLNTPEGSLVHQLAYNIIFTAGIATILFNANPLMKFDGYYILSDLLEIPNLMQRSTQMLTFLAQRHLFRNKDSKPPTASPSEALLLIGYGILAMIYRMFLFVSITLFVMGKMFAIGLLLAVWTAGMWFVLPLGKFVHWLAASSDLAEKRGRAILTSIAAGALCLLLLGAVPAPDRRRVSGVVESEARTGVFFDVDGFVAKSFVRPGQHVKQGDVLVEVDCEQLKAQLELARAQLREAEGKRREAVMHNMAAAQVAQEYCDAVRLQIGTLEGRLEHAQVRAPHDGVVVTRDPSDLVGAFVKAGQPVCEVAKDSALRVTAVITQPEADWITRDDYKVEARFVSEPGRVVKLNRERVVPAGTKELPHEAFGYQGGGSIETDPRDRSGMVSRAALFKGYFLLGDKPGPLGPGVMPGTRVSLRFELPPRPLLFQWMDQLEKTLQGRAKV